MRSDKTTLQDLSFFSASGADVFALLDHVVSQAGREALRRVVQEPPPTYEALLAAQEVTRWWLANPQAWTGAISNGTLVMLEKFFESADGIATPPAGISLVLGSFLQRLLNRNQYTFVQFSLTHLSDFLSGLKELAERMRRGGPPQKLEALIAAMERELLHPLVPLLTGLQKNASFTELSRLSFRARRELKNAVLRLTEQYALLDAWRALALATAANDWRLPDLLPSAPMLLEVAGLYHPLLATPVPYAISFAEGRNFLLLTGANMSGKTTFMRALGVASLLAHVGCGVPARQASFSFLKGIITNMHVEDNILRGESYFFAEVQRMKQTAQQINADAPFLVLMDELFKGTNVYDAYECTRAVVEGLLLRQQHLMILSTHLHEVAHLFEQHQGAQFAYFVTNLSEDGSYRFTYELKPGISDDRIGYRILLQEGVIALLQQGAAQSDTTK